MDPLGFPKPPLRSWRRAAWTPVAWTPSFKDATNESFRSFEVLGDQHAKGCRNHHHGSMAYIKTTWHPERRCLELATTNLVSLKAMNGIPAKHCSSGRNFPRKGLPFSLVGRRTEQARLGLPAVFQEAFEDEVSSLHGRFSMAGCGPIQQLSESLPDFDSRRCRSGRSALDPLAD